MRILMVCLGNICRSPLAEGILKQLAVAKKLDWEIDSAGTGGWHAGEAPDPRSVAVAKKHGIDISAQRARKFRDRDLVDFDLVYVMDAQNYNDIARYAQTDSERAKVRFIMNELLPGQNKAVADPYYNNNGFEEVYAMLQKACEAIVKKALSKQ